MPGPRAVRTTHQAGPLGPLLGPTTRRPRSARTAREPARPAEPARPVRPARPARPATSCPPALRQRARLGDDGVQLDRPSEPREPNRWL
ncbi:hypothetical protein DEH18_23265 [Streptomyces sp. NHF165]|nr:hypothetical protein DEH18_23265 [Streptomyces sp. NHF165]